MQTTHDAPVAEIVRFRLKPGADVPSFVADARATLAFVERMGGMMSRQLSVDEHGVWTDYLTWQSMEAARNAQAAAMQEPSFGPYMSHIDAESVEMRHADLHWSVGDATPN